jgi:hypothetical protein
MLMEGLRMESWQKFIPEYKRQLEQGYIQKAYQGLIQYILDLRNQFSKNFPDFAPGNIYHGYMDMTYFPVFPGALKSWKLKIAIVFVYDTFQFEAWLSGYNKNVQTQYWNLFKESHWNKYRLPLTTKGADSILEHTLAANPDFGDLNALTGQIVNGTVSFIRDIEDFLSTH